jgi:hypothetical protein
LYNNSSGFGFLKGFQPIRTYRKTWKAAKKFPKIYPQNLIFQEDLFLICAKNAIYDLNSGRPMKNLKTRSGP